MTGLLPILLAEDDKNDADLFRFALQRAGVLNCLHVAPDGEIAINYLAGTGNYSDRSQFPLPCLLVTDLKMPRCSGFDLLAWLQQQNGAYHFPKLVLSGSSHDVDLQRAIALGANGYLVKPSELLDLVKLAGQIKDKWLA